MDTINVIILLNVSLLHCFFLCLCFPASKGSLGNPSFESQWYNIEAQNPALRTVTVSHNLEDYPVLVDVQVKISTNCKDYIFTGIGSGHRDDDNSSPYGGTVYVYNQRDIIITFPIRNNNHGNGGIAFTGSHTLYHGPTEIEGPYYLGSVKVRAWLASDMPTPVFNMSINISNADYRELEHGLGSYPDILSVRTLLDNGYMSDAQGAALEEYIFGDYGGIIYGFNQERIFLWAGSRAVCSTTDGWGMNIFQNRGTVYVLGWKLKATVGHTVFSTSKSCIAHPYAKLPDNFDISNYYLSVKVKSNETGVIFNAVGSSMASGSFTFGGIVYAYTSNNVLIWQPKSAIGHLIYAGGSWGSNKKAQISDTVLIQIEVYYFSV